MEDLSSLAGGLTPVRVGGGMTTSTLHLQGQNGRRYVSWSVDKVPADLIEEFEGTPIESILRDQMSSFHPSGAVIVASLLEAVDVLHPSSLLMVVPDHPGLGPFREEFANMLVLFEERPDDVEGRPSFAGSSRIAQTARLFEILEEEPEDRVGARELLVARLIDLLVGDRDRSTNNYLWAQFDDPSGGHVWRPVPSWLRPAWRSATDPGTRTRATRRSSRPSRYRSNHPPNPSKVERRLPGNAARTRSTCIG